MNIEIINIDKQDICLKLNNKNNEDLCDWLINKNISDIKIIYKLKEDLRE